MKSDVSDATSPNGKPDTTSHSQHTQTRLFALIPICSCTIWAKKMLEGFGLTGLPPYGDGGL